MFRNRVSPLMGIWSFCANRLPAWPPSAKEIASWAVFRRSVRCPAPDTQSRTVTACCRNATSACRLHRRVACVLHAVIDWTRAGLDWVHTSPPGQASAPQTFPSSSNLSDNENVLRLSISERVALTSGSRPVTFHNNYVPESNDRCIADRYRRSAFGTGLPPSGSR